MLELARHGRDLVDDLMTSNAKLPGVKGAFLITARYGLMVHVIARDMTHLKDLAYGHFISRVVMTRITSSIICQAANPHHTPL